MDERALDAIAATQRMITELEAVQCALYAGVVHAALDGAAPGSASDLPIRAASAEIGAALHVSDRTVQRRLSEAFTMTTRFPTTFRAFAEGRVSRAHVGVIVDAGLRIDDDAARSTFEELAVAVAERESAGRLRPIARLLAEEVLPRPLDERHRDAAEERGVWVTDLDDGMSELRALLPSVLAHGILDRLTRMGGAQVEQSATDEAEGCPTDDRTTSQRRADLLADLLLTGAPSACTADAGLGSIRAEVLVTVPVLTLLNRDDSAVDGVGVGVDGYTASTAMLDGSAPIDAATARRLAGGARGWDRVLTHPITGVVLAVDRYRPSKEQRRHLRATDQRCRFPCCRQPAAHCDLDHLHDAARGGPTAVENLASECRRHHVLKHAAGWRVTRAPSGVVTWTSPNGRVYPDHPSGVAFTPTDPFRSDPPPRDLRPTGVLSPHQGAPF